MVGHIEDEYRKFSELKRDEILKLMDWCLRQPHLPNLTELEIVIFFHSCYNSVVMTQLRIDAAFTIRTHCPEFFANRDVLGKDVVAQMSLLLYTPLPGLTPDGYKSIFARWMDSDPSKFVFGDALKLFTMVSDMCIMDEGTVNGYMIVMDMSGVTFGHLAKLGISTLKKYMLFVQEGLPVRLKGLHFVNTVSFMDKVLALMRPFMKRELLDVLELHSTVESLRKHVFPEQLPNEYGGKAGTFDELREKTYNQIKENRDFFLREESERRVNEKLRPGKPKGAGDLFGMEGNFKKLEFD
ncbi:alpha-tocopherol transfer protein-like [Bradysia coprophila]|uniref:alpha-tocopherol transfer protein-like n=1 Tax=Bradysia coprophila TaxID=38358 RepID=UPI00187DCE70|nr:alpha-tocopherol transfer protein-like [Bradysia coprophila]